MRNIVRKVVVLGDSGSGKTAIVQRYVNDTFTDKYRVTAGAVTLKKTVEHEGNSVKLVIWDVAGHIHGLHHAYTSDANGIVLVCDLAVPGCAVSAVRWLNAISELTGNVPVVLAANKHDLAELPPDGCAILPGGVTVLPTSARTGENINELFMELVARMI